MPHIVVLASGGTISSRSRAGAVVAVDDAAALMAGTDIDVEDGVTIEARDVMRTGSYRMTLAGLRAIVDAVGEQLERPDVDGAVVTHGTDTLEETAILLDLVHSDDRPVVLTGAQRAADVADTDGPRNLRDAIRVAADVSARGAGVLVVFNGSVLAARNLRKSHTVDLAAFANPAGTVATVHSAGLKMLNRPVRPPSLPPPSSAFDSVRVDIVVTYPGGDDALLRAAVRAGARGLVLVGQVLAMLPLGSPKRSPISSLTAWWSPSRLGCLPALCCLFTATVAVTTWWQPAPSRCHCDPRRLVSCSPCWFLEADPRWT